MIGLTITTLAQVVAAVDTCVPHVPEQTVGSAVRSSSIHGSSTLLAAVSHAVFVLVSPLHLARIELV